MLDLDGSGKIDKKEL